MKSKQVIRILNLHIIRPSKVKFKVTSCNLFVTGGQTSLKILTLIQTPQCSSVFLHNQSYDFFVANIPRLWHGYDLKEILNLPCYDCVRKVFVNQSELC